MCTRESGIGQGGGGKTKETAGRSRSVEDTIAEGKRLLEEGDFDGALALFDGALRLNDRDPDAWNCRGAALRSLGRYDEAIECFNRSLAIDPRDRDAS